MPIIEITSKMLCSTERDLFGTHQSKAAEFAKKLYDSDYAPDCCHLVSTYDLRYMCMRAFMHGVKWKECVSQQDYQEITNEKICP